MRGESKTDAVHIALAANHRYLPGLEATLASMLLSAKRKDRLVFHVFADGLSEEDCNAVKAVAERYGLREPIDFIHPDMEPLKKLFAPYKGSHAAFLRLYLCEFFKELDWIVYSDVDILWYRDVCELWEERDDSVSVLWSADCPSIQQGVCRGGKDAWRWAIEPAKYACSGVMLMNLRRMREVGFIRQCADFALKWGTPGFVDQDIINHVCRNDAKLLDQRWDCMMPDKAAPSGVVVHCNGVGALFNGPYESWRPNYVIWFEFYFKRILGKEYRLSLTKRALIFLMSLVYPYRALAKFLTLPFGIERTDQLQRTLFFAWLRRRLPRVCG